MAVFFTYSFFTHLQFSDHQSVRSVEYLNQNSIDLKPLDFFDLYPVLQDLLNFLGLIDWLLSFHYYQSRSVYRELTKPWKIRIIFKKNCYEQGSKPKHFEQHNLRLHEKHFENCRCVVSRRFKWGDRTESL